MDNSSKITYGMRVDVIPENSTEILVTRSKRKVETDQFIGLLFGLMENVSGQLTRQLLVMP